MTNQANVYGSLRDGDHVAGDRDAMLGEWWDVGRFVKSRVLLVCLLVSVLVLVLVFVLVPVFVSDSVSDCGCVYALLMISRLQTSFRGRRTCMQPAQRQIAR